MIRNCPSCNAILSSYDKHFCSSCGKPLPKDLVEKTSDVVIKKTIYLNTSEKNNSTVGGILNFIKSIFGLRILLLIISLIGLIFLFLNFLPKLIMLVNKDNIMEEFLIEDNAQSGINISEESNKYLLDLGYMDSKPSKFSHSLIKYVPSNPNLVMEGGDINFLKKSLPELLKKFNILIGDTSSENFVLFVHSIQDVDVVSLILRANFDETPESRGGVYSSKVDNQIYVFTQSQSVLKSVDNCSKELEICYSKSGDFVNVLSKLPISGNLMIISNTYGREYLRSNINENNVFVKFLESNLENASIL